MHNTTRTCLLAVAAVVLLAACNRSAAPSRPALLDAKTQRAAAEKLVRSFLNVCLKESDARAAVRILETQGWPAFNTVWNLPNGIFLAAKPSPAGLFVISEPRPGAINTVAMTCVGHYAANDAGAMIDAIARRWGPGEPTAQPLLGSRAWAFRLRDGLLTPVAVGPRGPITDVATAGLRPGDAIVDARVAFNAEEHDVASVVAVVRRVQPH